MPRPIHPLLVTAAIAGILLTSACSGNRSDVTADEPPADPGGAACLPGTGDCDDSPQVDAPGPGAMCLPDTPDCVDTVVDTLDEASAIAYARSVLGLPEVELADVRVSRRGVEPMMLTEDYVLGRVTVELDADSAGVYRAVSSTVELLDGPQTFTR